MTEKQYNDLIRLLTEVNNNVFWGIIWSVLVNVIIGFGVIIALK